MGKKQGGGALKRLERGMKWGYERQLEVVERLSRIKQVLMLILKTR